MQTITRPQFQAAIEAGIEHAQDDLNSAEIENLRRIGRTAQYVGPTFTPTSRCEHICPAGQAGIFRDTLQWQGDLRFACAYDDALHDIPGHRLGQPFKVIAG